MTSSSLHFQSHSESDTDQLGLCLAAAVVPGLVVALNGQLGSGKTRLVRAVCQALGADVTRVNSPTFVIMQFYPDGRIPVVHMDTYRLGDPEEFLAIGADEYLHGGHYLCFVEWADRIQDVIPADHITVNISQTGVEGRLFEFSASGSMSEGVLQDLKARLNRGGFA